LRRLIVDRVGADFDPVYDVALGPWCFHKVEEHYPDWDTLPFVNPFPTAADRLRENDATVALTHQLLDKFWPELNRRHGVDYGRDFWHIVTFFWLCHLVQISWRVYRHVELFIERTSDQAFSVHLGKIGDKFEFEQTKDFLSGCLLPGKFRSYLVDRIVELLAPVTWQLEFVARMEAEKPSQAPNHPSGHPRRSVQKVSGVGRFDFPLSVYVDLLPRRVRNRSAQVSRTIDAKFPARFVDFVEGMMELTLPRSLGANFAMYDAAAQKTKFKPGRLRVVTVYTSEDEENFVVAHARRAGERILGVQHGGTYGWAATMSAHGEVEYLADVFLTWGWKAQAHYSTRFVPLPSPMLSRKTHQRANGGKVLLVTNGISPFWPRIDFFPMTLDERKTRRTFLKGLDSKVFGELLYRPYYLPMNLDDERWVKRHFPNIKCFRGDLDQELKRAKMLVVDHPVTTFAVGLSANIPTVGLWDTEAWPIAPQAVPYFDALEKAGVIFGNPEVAAHHINEIWPDIDTWWEAPARQAARKTWCDQYARRSSYWLLEWMTGLAKLSVAA